MRHFRILALCAMIVLLGTSETAVAQWLSLPLAGTPRTPEGKPNLNAATPRTAEGKPDLSGIWRADNQRWNENLVPAGSDAPMLPWAAELYKHRVETFGWDRPEAYCMPHGVPDAMTVAGIPWKILQMPGATVLLFEEFHKYRQIHTDGRLLPVNSDQPAWYGYSVGRWEGDTFVVETAGFKEGSWLDNSGHPHTEALRTTPVRNGARCSIFHSSLMVFNIVCGELTYVAVQSRHFVKSPRCSISASASFLQFNL